MVVILFQGFEDTTLLSLASIVSFENPVTSGLCLFLSACFFFFLPAFKIVSLLFALQHTVNVPRRGEKKSGRWVGRPASMILDPSYKPKVTRP